MIGAVGGFRGWRRADSDLSACHLICMNHLRRGKLLFKSSRRVSRRKLNKCSTFLAALKTLPLSLFTSRELKIAARSSSLRARARAYKRAPLGSSKLVFDSPKLSATKQRRADCCATTIRSLVLSSAPLCFALINGRSRVQSQRRRRWNTKAPSSAWTKLELK